MPKLEVLYEDSTEINKTVARGIDAHDAAHFGHPIETITIAIRNDDGDLIAGGSAAKFGWDFFIKNLWVDEHHRRQGLGRQILSEFERIAKEQDCTRISLRTWIFQGKDFYLSCGYEALDVMENAVGGDTVYFMIKKLS